MTDQIEHELARRSIGDAARPNVGVTRTFLAEVLQTLRAKNALIAELKEGSDICRCCGTPRNQFEPVDTAQSKPGEVNLQFARLARLKAGDERSAS